MSLESPTFLEKLIANKPMMIGIACLAALLVLAWIFVGGRLLHSAVQILTGNIRLRGLVFMVNFLAVLGLWAIVLAHAA